jgi:hypothetical protein
VSSICQASRARGATGSSKFATTIEWPHRFVRHSYTIASVKKGILFSKCVAFIGTIATPPSSQSESAVSWSFNHYEKAQSFVLSFEVS